MIPQFLPNERRNFVHRRIIGAATSFITSGGNPLAAAGSFLRGSGGSSRTVAPAKSLGTRERKAQAFSPESLRLTASHVAHGHTFATDRHAFLTKGRVEAARGLSFQIPCIPPFFRNEATGRCELDLVPGPGGGGTGSERDVPMGQAVAGAFGIPAIVPSAVPQTRLSCPSGMVLGRDDLCYPKQVLRRDSKFRKHRPGVRPILTGGQRNAIRRAKAAITTARSAISGLGVTVKKSK